MSNTKVVKGVSITRTSLNLLSVLHLEKITDMTTIKKRSSINCLKYCLRKGYIREDVEHDRYYLTELGKEIITATLV